MWLSPGQELSQSAAMIRRTLILLTLGLSLTALPQGPASAREVIDIVNNSGGNVLQTIKRRNQLQASGKLVRIRGYCRSACTLYLTMPNACIGPGATIGFHAPRVPGTRIIPPVVGDLMGQFYRGEIRRRWYAEWQYSLKMHKLSAAQYKKLDPQIKYCWSNKK